MTDRKHRRRSHSRNLDCRGGVTAAAALSRFPSAPTKHPSLAVVGASSSAFFISPPGPKQHQTGTGTRASQTPGPEPGRHEPRPGTASAPGNPRPEPHPARRRVWAHPARRDNQPEPEATSQGHGRKNRHTPGGGFLPKSPGLTDVNPETVRRRSRRGLISDRSGDILLPRRVDGILTHFIVPFSA